MEPSSVPTPPPATTKSRSAFQIALIVIGVLGLVIGVPLSAYFNAQRISAETTVNIESVAPVATAPMSDEIVTDTPAAPQVVLPTFTVNSPKNTMYGTLSRTCGKYSSALLTETLALNPKLAVKGTGKNTVVILHVGDVITLPVECDKSLPAIKVKTVPTPKPAPSKAEPVKVAKSVTPAAELAPVAPALVASAPRPVVTTNNVMDCNQAMPDGKIASDKWLKDCGKMAFRDMENEFEFEAPVARTVTVVDTAPASAPSTLVLVADPVFECTTDDPSISYWEREVVKLDAQLTELAQRYYGWITRENSRFNSLKLGAALGDYTDIWTRVDYNVRVSTDLKRSVLTTSARCTTPTEVRVKKMPAKVAESLKQIGVVVPETKIDRGVISHVTVSDDEAQWLDRVSDTYLQISRFTTALETSLDRYYVPENTSGQVASNSD